MLYERRRSAAGHGSLLITTLTSGRERGSVNRNYKEKERETIEKICLLKPPESSCSLSRVTPSRQGVVPTTNPVGIRNSTKQTSRTSRWRGPRNSHWRPFLSRANGNEAMKLGSKRKTERKTETGLARRRRLQLGKCRKHEESGSATTRRYSEASLSLPPCERHNLSSKRSRGIYDREREREK